MTNIAAAIGLGQIERLAHILKRKQEIAARYRQLLARFPVKFQTPTPDIVSFDWLTSVLLPRGTNRNRLMATMSDRGIDARPVFYCAHTMPMYCHRVKLPIAEDIAMRGVSLPSYPLLSDGDIARVVEALDAALREQGFVR
jgi:perosamine synthetase